MVRIHCATGNFNAAEEQVGCRHGNRVMQTYASNAPVLLSPRKKQRVPRIPPSILSSTFPLPHPTPHQVLRLGDPAAAFHLARQYEAQERISEAIKFYTMVGACVIVRDALQ